MKRTLCILLSLMLAVTGFAGLCVPASAADCQVGDIIAFGSYPQSRVTDDATINTLNAAADGWQSYGYYSSWGSPADGSMSPKDYMQYCDVTVNGQKYRGVQCTQYRPKCTGYSASADNSYQDDNGYSTNTVYWFRYESLHWSVLDPATGLVLCETIIDSQPVNNYALQEGGKYYGDADKAHYANNYAESSLRAWLNDDFYSTAFTASQQDMITVTTLDNRAYSTGFSGFDSASTTDKVFLLSYKEAQNTAYGFCSDINASDAARKAEGSDYAKCQGLSVTSGGTSPWWLRSAGYTSAAVCSVHAAGSLYYNYSAYYTYFGVRPAVTVDLDAVVVPYRDGDVIEFGSYLQGKLTNEESIAALEAAAPDFSQWTSYSYYTGTGNNTDGSMTASDYMRYCEITLGDKKYRGVRFTQYRPWMTGMKSTKSASEQDDHGYETDTTYWFRYRPLQWRVLDAQKGILLCETLIDSQPMNSYVLESGTDDYGETAYWGDADQSRYANNYAGSDLRQWLNNDFLNAAFSPKEQAVLTYTTLDNSADESVSRPAYGSETTTDRVFLLSYADAQNAAYGFTDNDSRLMKGSGYAKCQGLSVSSSYSPWLLRSPGNGSREMILVNNKGAFITTNYSYVTHFGIRPAISVDMDALYALLNHVHSFDAPKWNWAGDRSSATATFTCADCGETKSVTDESPAEIDVTAANCTDDKTVAYTASVKLDGMVYTNTSNAVAVPDTALGHDYSVVHKTVAPTIMDKGYTLYACSRCGDVDPTHRDFVPAKQIEATDKPVQLVKDGRAANILGAQQSKIWFGSYKQSGSKTDGYSVDPVKWRVLSNADGKLFLLSDQNLDVFFYHERYRPTTWETCDMHKWLNDLAPYEDYDTANFMRNAFASGELGAVLTTDVQTDGSNATQDKVFLLSVDDVQNAAYGFTDDASRLAVNTQYVAGGGAIRQGMNAAGTADYWWLRTQGAFDDRAAIVNNTGYLDTHGYDVYNNGIAVRPAFNLDLSKVLFTSAAEGGKPDGGLQELPKYTGSEWKLTMLDDSRSGFTASADSRDGDVWTIRYSGAQTGENEKISAMIVDADGAVTCYGVLGAAEAGDDNTVTVDLSGKYRTGDTLYVFNEQINGDKKTDYASVLQQIAKLSDLYVGKIVEFGSYPQSRVTDDATLDALNDAAPDYESWTSYGYYSGMNSWSDGQMTAKDYMRYCDVTVDGQMYRGVRFSQYRPYYTGFVSSEEKSNQDNNGYNTGVTYWFRYDPLCWRVLDPDTGLVLCETVVDSQSFNSYVLSAGTGSNTSYWGDAGMTHYASKYAESSLRQWLNDDFYNAAFTAQQKNAITATTLDNSAYGSSSSAYDSVTTTDKVFLLSFNEVLNPAYGFSAEADANDLARQARCSDYAKCQGIYGVTTSDWWLRSAGSHSGKACYVDSDGPVIYQYPGLVGNTGFGVRPAMTLDPDALFHDHAYGAPVWDWADNHSGAAAAFTCTECGDTQTVDATIDVTVVSEEDCTNDRVVTYTASVTFDGTEYTDTTDKITVPGTALDHDYSVVHETVAPTYTDEGYTIYACARCGDVDPTHRDIVDALTPPPDTVYDAGDILEFGSYPQTRVTDETTLDALNAAQQTWQSYGYYSGEGNLHDGKMAASDYMQYCDVTVDGQKYRGVRFTQYRPRYTGSASAAVSSYQDDNGYAIYLTYWFLYEPLQWRVLDPATGLVLCETIIDSQPYNSFILASGTDANGKQALWGDADKTHYANDYAASDIRAWLNGDFYNTAFLTAQDEQIVLTTLDNSACKPSYSAYDSAPTTDKVFLLSYGEALNTAYGFDSGYMANDPARQAQGTDYAKCQGLQTVGTKQNAYWRLRSAGGSSNDTCLADSDGWLTESFLAYTTCYGIRPAMRLGYAAFNDYKAKQKAAADALAQTQGSKICPVRLEEAKDQIDAIVYDSRKAMDENKETVDAVIAALENGAFDHDYDAVVTEPTCTEKGYTTYTCFHCKDKYTGDETENRGHDYSVVHETVAPTAADEGYTLYECSRCGDVDPTRRDVVPPTSADGKVPVRLIPDKTKVRPGGTITYTVKIGPVTEMTGADLWLVLPDGLTVDDYDLSAAYAANDPDAALRFSPTNMQFLIFSIAQRPYTTAEETDLMTFICSVDSGASGEKIIELTKCEFAGQAQPSIPTTYDPAGSAVTVVTDSATIITGDTIRFGSYPQSLVKDSATLTALNAAAPDSESWTSYGYYSGTGDEVDGQMTAKDYMQYCDVMVNGMKYRGVRFSQYRPFSTGDDSTADNTLQIENGYTTDTIYWFHWDPLQWRVLDPDAGLLLCESAIDAQPYQNLLWRNGNKYYQGVNSTVYANDYATSSVREWLNNDFFNAAFTTQQKAMIAATTLDNRANGTEHPVYDSVETTDKVFLLSSREAVNTAYGFKADPDADDAASMTQGTDYALCQGVEVDENHVHWLLRSAGYISDTVCAVDQYGHVGDFYGTAQTGLGIRPAITVDLEDFVSSYKTGDIVEYGSYPQAKVTDDATIDALNAAAPDSGSWTSYGYYSGEGETADGQMTAKDYMRYCDVTVDGQKYRGVTFSSYRPNNTGYKSAERVSAQHDNGYRTGVTYWFRYEPLQWRVLDPATGLVLCETLIDSQPYNNYAIYVQSDNDSYWGDADKTHYANNYAEGSLRQWLNDDFLGTAFTAEDEKRIASSTLDNSACRTDYSDYDSVPTTDKVFLLSWNDVLTPAYGFSAEDWADDPVRQTTSTDYAKCQGVAVSSRNGCSSWYLRSAGEYSGCVCAVNYDGWINTRVNAYATTTGIRPAMMLDLYLLNPPAHVHTYGEPVWDWAGNYSSAAATFTCTGCGDEQTVTDDEIDATVVSAEDCTNDRVVKYTASVEFNGTNYTETTNEVAVPGTATGHTFAWVTDTEPTCGADGVKHEECSVCHAKQNEGTPIPATGNHSWEWIVDTDETCGIDGVKHEECSVCHAKQNEGTPIPATGRHNFAEWVDNPAMTATCTEAGQEISRCTRCDTLGTRDKAALGHEYTVLHETIEPTCTADGYSTYECVRCGDVDPTHKDIVKALNHDWKTEWSKDGANHWHACTRCDAKNDEAAHTYGDVSYTWEQTAGTWKATAKRTCTVCKWDETETVTAAGVKSKEPTCTVNGETTYTAAFENAAFTTQTKTVADIDALNHDWKTEWSKDGANHWHDCTRCDEKNDEAAHTYGGVSYTWTQTRGAWKATAKRTCTVCEWDETETVTATGAQSKAPTCTVNGETTYTAAFENAAFTTQTKTVADIASLGHAYDAVVTEPTCIEDGYTTHTCSRCGDTYTDSETGALGHTEAAPVKEKETAATCETDGSFEEVVYCTLCGAELSRKTVVIPALGHEDADNNGHCDRCDEQMTGGDHCAWCGKIHNCCTICGMLTRCFHTFLYKVKPYILPALCFASSAFLLWLILK